MELLPASITRGCDNMCNVLRGALPVDENAAEPQSIMKEIQDLWDK
jgi:hypothetical protein